MYYDKKIIQTIITCTRHKYLSYRIYNFQAIWIFSVVDYKPVSYKKAIGGEYFYPDWAIAMGWCITATSFLPIPLFALYNVYKAKADGLWNVSMANTLQSSENNITRFANLYSILIISCIVYIFRNFWSRSNQQFNIAPVAARLDWMKIMRHMQTHDSH